MPHDIRKVHFTMHVEDGIIALIDIGTGISITNAAAEVVAELATLFGDDLTTMRIIYRDTMGVWDGLAHQGSRFIAFVPIRSTDRYLAVERARRGKDGDDKDWPTG